MASQTPIISIDEGSGKSIPSHLFENGNLGDNRQSKSTKCGTSDTYKSKQGTIISTLIPIYSHIVY